MPEFVTPAFAGLLLRSVPQVVRRDAHVAMGALAPWGFVSPQLVQDTNGGVADHELHVDGELVQIPYRVSFPWPSTPFAARLHPRRKAVLSAWMTRSDRAGTRQRALRELVTCREPWIVPFVVQLCGEYVHEIGADVARFVTVELPRHTELRNAFARFVRDNPRYLATTRHRAVGFRDLDHRWTFRDDLDRPYPQIAALDALAVLAYGGGHAYPGEPPARRPEYSSGVAGA
ncbi:hypothetical protein [Pseudonocardia sediminis]|uniref:hypothetical protein n=1 Tax=Pseudonocardia sediminis TaxID=1397368 RepID=UPI001029A482|nr:hypothetical protein [Pseudonocardia sediminis]